MKLPALRAFNPLRTLAGQLIVVTIVAVIASHAIASVLFAQERGRSMRSVIETNAIERMTATADRIRSAPPNERDYVVRGASDLAVRFSLNAAPAQAVGRDASRIARDISERLGGLETHARVRTVEVAWPRRSLFHRRDDGARWERGLDQNPSAPGHEGAGPAGPQFPRHMETPDDPPPMRRVDELTVSIAIAPNSWLHARAYLPAPRPLPTSLWLSAALSIVAVAFAAALIARRIGRPLAELTRASQALGVGDVKVRAPETGPEDVRRASAAFNAMAERMGRQIQRQRQMLWALSHDLRTPITALRLRAELLDDDADKQKILNALADMESLTEQALALARAGASEEARARVDLSELVETLCGELQDMGVQVRAVTHTPAFAECRPDEIARALRNLAENAQKYAGGGEMETSIEDGFVTIEVRDQGPGIPEAELARVTEPFFRADEARSQTSDGVGLGLAIAQAIADGHGGKLILSNRSPRGLSAKLILPA